MPSFDLARLDLANYPHHVELETRFQDLDPLNHINNVAMAGIFENGRVRFNRDMVDFIAQREAGDRWLVARVEVNYLAEAHFPDPVLIGNAIGHIGNRSWHILSAASQNGQIVALCDTVLVYQSGSGAGAIADDMRQELQARRFKIGF
jgi:acyl-CoA thioester hydrolase